MTAPTDSCPIRPRVRQSEPIYKAASSQRPNSSAHSPTGLLRGFPRPHSLSRSIEDALEVAGFHFCRRARIQAVPQLLINIKRFEVIRLCFGRNGVASEQEPI